jgi:hypothetical protein
MSIEAIRAQPSTPPFVTDVDGSLGNALSGAFEISIGVRRGYIEVE